ncbi:hypothetical protein Ptr902_05578 [Pyrenophora tritici-repentis]|nr:hypothetical protein Ptr902_05578 [Pyrenophora tritici-repentis]
MRSLIPLSLFGLASLALDVPDFETVATNNGKISGHRSPRANEVWDDCPQQAAIQSNFPGFTPQARTILNLSTVSAGTQRSDDCLILNIWSKPSNKSAENKKPVFVLFHGGRFAGDNTNTLFANGQYLVNNTDIIVVSVNYRLNIFGFPGGPNTDTNLGLRDQRLAVQWL